MAGCQLPRTSALLRGLLPAKPPRNLELWVLISVDWVKELLMGACGFCVLLTNQRNSIWQGHYRSQDSGLKAQVDTWDGHKCWKCQQSESRNTPASQDNGSCHSLSLSLSLSLPASHFLADETNATSVSFDKSLTSPSVRNRDWHPNLFDLATDTIASEHAGATGASFLHHFTDVDISWANPPSISSVAVGNVRAFCKGSAWVTCVMQGHLGQLVCTERWWRRKSKWPPRLCECRYG